MTILMYNIDRAGITIMMDTLATADDVPAKFTSKLRLFPHIQLAVANTGFEALGTRWGIDLNETLMVLDIVELDKFAPTRIRELWADLRAENPGKDLGTATIYHFGRSFRGGEYLGYAYRSTSDFASEKLQYAFGVKPHPTGPYRYTAPEATDEWIVFARKVRAEQDLLPLGERIHIGGSLVLTLMTSGGMAMQEVYQFEDHADHWNAMNQRRVELSQAAAR